MTVGQKDMSVLARKVDTSFEVASDQSDRFLSKSASSNSFTETMKRAKRNMRDFKKREVKRM